MSTAVVGRKVLGVLVAAGAQPAWTPVFPLGVPAGQAAMAPDGTTVYADLVSTTMPDGTRVVAASRRVGVR